jgi:trehalose-6-phosphate synthase
MGYAERRRRWEKLMDNVVSENVAAWRESFVDALKGEIRTAPARLANDAA